MAKRIIDTSAMPKRSKKDREFADRITSLVRAGGGMKHRLMTTRLETPDATAETRHCAICNMHVTLTEASYCLLCPRFPEVDEVGDGYVHVTLAQPDWWRR